MYQYPSKNYPFKRQPHKIVQHTDLNCFSVFGYFVGLALKGLRKKRYQPETDINR